MRKLDPNSISEIKSGNQDYYSHFEDQLCNGFTLIQGEDGKQTIQKKEMDKNNFFALPDDDIIVSVTPLILYMNDKREMLSFLCKNKNNKLFTISDMYEFDMNYEYQFGKDHVPFYNSKEIFPIDHSRQMISNMLLNTLPKFISNFVFFTKNRLFPDPDDGYICTNATCNGKEYTFKLPMNVFISLKFTEAYICDMIPCQEDLLYANMCGVSTTFNPRVVVIDKVDTLVHCALVDKKRSHLCMYHVKCHSYIKQDAVERFQLMFRGSTPNNQVFKKAFDIDIKTMKDEYGKDANQYTIDLQFSATLNDNHYSIYVGVNTKKEYIMFVLDSNFATELTQLLAEKAGVEY